MDGTILGQGTFTQPSTAIIQVVAIPSGVDWMYTYNLTAAGRQAAGTATTPTASTGVKFYWQRGFAAGNALEYQTNAGSTATLIKFIASGGFTLYDPSGQTAGAQSLLGPAVNITTGVSNATQPVVTTTNTTGVVAGTVVRIYSPGITDVNGIDMVVSSVSANTSFTLLYTNNALATAPGAVGTLGTYRIVNSDSLFYPRRRFVTNISRVSSATQVATSIAHGLTPGQAIRFNIPSVSGMVELNSTPENNYMVATVTSLIDLYTFTIDIDVTAFTAFTWPTVAQQPSSFPTFDPVGENTAFALASPTIQIPGVVSATVGSQIYNTNTGILADSTVNTGYLGMILPIGADSPGGQANDVVYWVAGKSTYGGL